MRIHIILNYYQYKTTFTYTFSAYAKGVGLVFSIIF